jgi:polygalacturonase
MNLCIIASLITLTTIVTNAPAGDVCRQINVPERAQVSKVYRITVDGMPLKVVRCDGRAGPASYVHVMLEKAATFKILCDQPEETWTFNSTPPVEARWSESAMVFSLDKPAKILLMTGARERLFIFIDVPEMSQKREARKHAVSIDRYLDGADRTKLLTREIQRAIDDVAEKPEGGTLVFSPGVYRTGTISIKSGVHVHLSPGAMIQGSDDPSDYPFDPGTQEAPDRTQDIRSRLILFDHVENAGLSGFGQIDGAGHIIRAEHKRVPNLIRVRHSRNVTVEDVLLRRAAGWNTHIFHSSDVTVRNIKSFSNWSDGMDVDNSSNVSIEDVLISSQDDAFVIKSTGFAGHAKQVSDIHLDRAVLWTEKSCVKIGTETLADRMERVLFENVTIAGARGALVIYLRDGAVVKDVTYRNVVINNAQRAVEWEIVKRKGVGRIEDVILQRIRVDQAIHSTLAGYDQSHMISNVSIRDFMVAGKLATTPEQARFRMNDHVKQLHFAKSDAR